MAAVHLEERVSLKGVYPDRIFPTDKIEYIINPVFKLLPIDKFVSDREIYFPIPSSGYNFSNITSFFNEFSKGNNEKLNFANNVTWTAQRYRELFNFTDIAAIIKISDILTSNLGNQELRYKASQTIVHLCAHSKIREGKSILTSKPIKEFLATLADPITLVRYLNDYSRTHVPNEKGYLKGEVAINRHAIENFHPPKLADYLIRKSLQDKEASDIQGRQEIMHDPAIVYTRKLIMGHLTNDDKKQILSSLTGSHREFAMKLLYITAEEMPFLAKKVNDEQVHYIQTVVVGLMNAILGGNKTFKVYMRGDPNNEAHYQVNRIERGKITKRLYTDYSGFEQLCDDLFYLTEGINREVNAENIHQKLVQMRRIRKGNTIDPSMRILSNEYLKNLQERYKALHSTDEYLDGLDQKLEDLYEKNKENPNTGFACKKLYDTVISIRSKAKTYSDVLDILRETQKLVYYETGNQIGFTQLLQEIGVSISLKKHRRQDGPFILSFHLGEIKNNRLVIHAPTSKTEVLIGEKIKGFITGVPPQLLAA